MQITAPQLLRMSPEIFSAWFKAHLRCDDMQIAIALYETFGYTVSAWVQLVRSLRVNFTG